MLSGASHCFNPKEKKTCRKGSHECLDIPYLKEDILRGTSFILAMFHEEQSLWNPKKTGCLLIDDRDRELLLPYFLFTGSKVETPATAIVRTARTTPPATTLKSKFFKDGLMPGCAASASSGTTAAANKANPVTLVTSCSFCETLHTEASYNWLHQKCE